MESCYFRFNVYFIYQCVYANC